MPTITVNIADRGTQFKDSKTGTVSLSAVGHMWFELKDNNGNSTSYGFAPAEHNEPIGPGKVNYTDSSSYLGARYYTREVTISQAQYNAIKSFGETSLFSNPDSVVTAKDVNGINHNFALHYNGLTNSCIDYTWMALTVGGLNPKNFQGAAWPTWNKSFIEKTLDQYESTINSINALFALDKQMQTWFASKEIDELTWVNYTSWSTSLLINSSPTQSTSTNSNLNNPIGAFYESKPVATDAAGAITKKTFRILNSEGLSLTAAQLAALDTDGDAELSGTELTGLMAWRDLNEDGINQMGTEYVALGTALANAGLSSVRSSDYAFYTAGNASYRTVAQNTAAAPVNSLVAPAAPTALASNYTTLRTTDNRFWVSADRWIDWLPNYMKTSSDQRNLIGTDADDIFTSNYFSYYGALTGIPFDITLMQNLYAGGGNDEAVGSSRNDNIWGGTGNDLLFGCEGDDKLYGEEGDDELQGEEGNDVVNGGQGNDLLFGGEGKDTLVGADGDDELQGGADNDQLDAGAGNDKLFGQVGNDILNGGDGNDIMRGFTGINAIQQTLYSGESDADTMFGGNGADQLAGGLDNDYMDGGADNDNIDGDDGNDKLFGAAGNDELEGGAGNDVMDGGEGADNLFGGVGNDQLWGGNGDDFMNGFTAVNDAKQTLAAGEADNDKMYGGAGDDFMVGALGNDQLWGGTGNDELQGGDGSDALYGEVGNDKLFGQVGNDTIYGGDGDDVIAGFTGINSAKQALAAGESDNDFLYGGAGNDLILGRFGNDYIDGGAGADDMEGGQGNDTYVVNSVNDTILEQQDEGYDVVISSSNYILNANIEELRLVEGYDIHGTGNSLKNRIVGNNRNNILDGVTGADTLVGGLGNDTYYVDEAGDKVVELAGEGTDIVNSSISYTLGANVENLSLLDFSKAEKGVADGVNIVVYGYPKAYELDYMQGNAVAGYKGTCALTSIANLVTQADQSLTEAQVVQNAITHNWCVTDATTSDSRRGGSTYIDQQALLDSYGIRNDIIFGYNEQAIANLIKGGRGVIIGLNAGKLWGDNAYEGNGRVNHVITVTGVACDATTGAINGFYIADSGRSLVSDMTRYVSVAEFRNDANVPGAYTIYTVEPVKLWNENINATGNELDNTITGNRGDNILTGGDGNDSLTGQAGNDTYMFTKGDGQDKVTDNDATAGNIDVLRLKSIRQTNLWFTRVGNNLQIDVLGTSDQITVRNWYVRGSSGTDNQIERITTADGLTMYNTDVEQFVQAMSAFAPPSATQTSWTNGQTSNDKVLLTVTH